MKDSLAILKCCVWSGFLAIVAFQICYLYRHYLAYRRRDYLAYVWYLSACLAYFFLLHHPPILAGRDSIFGIASSAIVRPLAVMLYYLYYRFVVDFLEFRLLSPRVYNRIRMLQKLMVVAAVLLTICIFIPGTASAASYLYLYFCLFLFIASLYFIICLWRLQTRFSGYFLRGSFFALSGAFIANLIVIIDPSQRHPAVAALCFIAPMAGIVAETYYFASGLAYKAVLFEQEAKARQDIIIDQYRENEQLLREKEEIRQRIASDIHDELGGSISTIRILSDLLGRPSALPAREYSEKLSVAATEFARRMQTIVWSMNSENDDAANFMDYVSDFAAGFFEHTAIRYTQSYTTQPGRAPEAIHLNGLCRKHLMLIIKEAFNNILKHAGAGVVHTGMDFSAAGVSVTINDDGSGFREARKFGNGLKSMSSRIGQLGGTFTISAKAGGGTVVQVSCPL